MGKSVKFCFTLFVTLKKYGIAIKEKISRSGNVNLYYCKDGFEFWSQKLHKSLDRKPLENYFANKRMRLEAQRAAQPQRTPPTQQMTQSLSSTTQP